MVRTIASGLRTCSASRIRPPGLSTRFASRTAEASSGIVQDPLVQTTVSKDSSGKVQRLRVADSHVDLTPQVLRPLAPQNGHLRSELDAGNPDVLGTSLRSTRPRPIYVEAQGVDRLGAALGLSPSCPKGGTC